MRQLEIPFLLPPDRQVRLKYQPPSSYLTTCDGLYTRGAMTAVTHSTLAELTRGFLSKGQMRVEGQSVLYIADYDLTRFDDNLFGHLGIDYPPKLARAVTKRRAEYLAGRAIARVAQHELEIEGQVGIGADGAPVWPQGLSGSISHSRTRCACLLVPRQASSLGIDTEAIAGASELSTILLTVANARERVLLEGSDNIAVDATLCFSAKETLFKALYSTVKRYFGFECAQLTNLPKDGRIRLSLTQTLHPKLRKGRTFEIKYEIDANYVLTWMTP